MIVAFYLFVALVLVGAGGFFWLRSIESRRAYVCTSCGREQRVEHMHASSCSVCGAPLREV